MKPIALLMLLWLVMACPGCDDGSQNMPGDAADAPRASAGNSATRLPAQAPQPSGPRVVFLGDSLTAGYGIDVDQAFPAVVAQLLAEEGIEVQVVNAGVSGDTTAGGLSRLAWVLKQQPDVVVVGLGGNDGLRGLDLESSEKNLRSIVQRSRDAGAGVLLLGMLIPPNYGPDYTSQFRKIYPRVARDLDVPLVPFLLEGVGGEQALNLPDGIHPTPEGHQRVAENVLPHLRALLQKQSTTGPR